MKINIISNVPYLQHLNGEHDIKESINIKELLNSIGVKWDYDALVILNGNYSIGEENLKQGDTIELLIPLAGG